jgi:hypothetical protein
MSDAAGAPDGFTLVLRVSLPAGGAFHGIASDLAAKIAEYLGSRRMDPKTAALLIQDLATAVVPPGNNGTADITFEFHQTEGELRIEARCAGRTSEARHSLPT